MSETSTLQSDWINAAIQQHIAASEDELVALRRQLHSQPEVSWEEVNTTAFVCRYLDELGIPYRQTEPTGVIADIQGGKPGKKVALRADMDALSVEQIDKNLPYASQIEGRMHACGHDAHTSMLLVAARALVSVQADLPGSVRLIFQPAEEVAQGAREMVRQGAMENVDNVFGIHIWSQIPTHAVACDPGPSFASADLFTVTFQGRGGHGAMPEDCIDTAIVASSFVMNVQSIVSRTVSPKQPAVVTIGKMNVGTRFNIIAEHAVIEGTVRCFDPQVRDHVQQQLQHYADQVAALYGATAKLDYVRGTQAVINEEHAVIEGTVRCFDPQVRDHIQQQLQHYADQVAALYGATAKLDYVRGTQAVINEEHSAKLVQQVASAAFGEHVLYNEEPTMGGEDFSYYLDEAPGSFALVGSGNADKDTQWAHHHGRFNIDEDALATGAELYAQYAWAYLNQH